LDLIPDLNGLICRGRWRDALALLCTKNPFPDITGRICPALCEDACVRRIDFAAVPIRHIELSLAEKGFAEGWHEPKATKTKTGKSVAIIGSGPAGLACATYLHHLGHRVVVFEKAKIPGGILSYGIPDFKLKKSCIRRRIDIMKEKGIKFETGVLVGVDIPLRNVMKDFDAIVLAAGALAPRDLNIPGRQLNGIQFAMEYLTQQNRLNNNESVEKEVLIDARGKTVVVIGGGDTGADCVETASRQGALKIYHLELMPPPPEMSSRAHSVQQHSLLLRAPTAESQACSRKWNILTNRFIGQNDRLNGVETVEIEWSKDSSGRIMFSEKPNSTVVILCDLALLAIGFESPGNDALLVNSGVAFNELGFVRVDQNMMTAQKGVFCAGDMTHGSSLVIKAIDSGVQAAKNVATFLQ
jgi:NAD(P)H-dependent glutamate synthase small subunit